LTKLLRSPRFTADEDHEKLRLTEEWLSLLVRGDPFHWPELLSAVVWRFPDNPDVMLQFVDKMRELQVPLRNAEYSFIIKAFFAKKDHDQARKTLEEMKQAGLTPSVLDYNLLVCLYVDNGDEKSMLELLAEMFKAGTNADTSTFNIWMTLYAKHGMLESFMRIAKLMEENGLVPDQVTLGLMLDVCVKTNFMAGLDLLQHLVKIGANVDISGYNIVLRAAAQRGDWESVQTVLEMMAKQGLKVNVRTITNFIQARGTEPKDAIKLLNMLENGKGEQRPTTVTYNSVLDRLAEKGMTDEMMKMIATMQARPNTATMNILLKAHLAVGKHIDIFVFAKEHRITADVITFNTLLNAAGNSKNPDEAWKWYEQLKAHPKIKPNDSTYHSLLSAVGQTASLAKMVELFEEMQRYGCAPDARHFGSLIATMGASHSRSDPQTAMHVWNLMKDSRIDLRRVGMPLLTKLVRILSAQRNSEQGERVVKEMEATGMLMPDEVSTIRGCISYLPGVPRPNAAGSRPRSRFGFASQQ
jgi:pentatricopeptide repeat protein